MTITAIAIVSANGVIGDGERQPFEIAEDWARFKQVTSGHPLIMGRRTHEAIGRWLPGRTTIVVTSHPEEIAVPEPDEAVPEPDEAVPEPDGAVPEPDGAVPEPDEGRQAQPSLSLSRRRGYAVRSLAEALDLARTLDDEIFIGGGGTIYRQSWPVLTDLDVTEVHAQAEGAVRFPEIDPAEWTEVSRESREGFDFVHYRRLSSSLPAGRVGVQQEFPAGRVGVQQEVPAGRVGVQQEFPAGRVGA